MSAGCDADELSPRSRSFVKVTNFCVTTVSLGAGLASSAMTRCAPFSCVGTTSGGATVPSLTILGSAQCAPEEAWRAGSNPSRCRFSASLKVGMVQRRINTTPGLYLLNCDEGINGCLQAPLFADACCDSDRTDSILTNNLGTT